MAEGVFTPVIPDDKDIFLGEGVYYANYIDGISGEPIIGATRGGSKLEIEKVIREEAYDGAYGPTKGLRRYERYVPRFMVTLLKMSYVSLAYAMPVTVTDVGDYHEIAFRINIEDADYLTNITFVGNRQDGRAVIIIVHNPLNDGNISFDFKEKDELTSELQYTGHYLRTTPTTPPLEIWEHKT